MRRSLITTLVDRFNIVVLVTQRSLEEMKLFRHCMHGERFTEGEYPLLPLALQQVITALAILLPNYLVLLYILLYVLLLKEPSSWFPNFNFLSLPPTQLRTTLAGLKVRQMECSSEADSILALRSAKDKTGA